MKKEIASYKLGQFVDFKGVERLVVACAVSMPVKEGLTATWNIPGVEDSFEIVRAVSIGIAVYNPEDEFNYVVGCKKAQARAKNSNATLYATKSGMINTTMVTGLLTQEAEYLKNNPDAYIKGYKESKRAYLEKQKKADIFTALPEQAKETINYLRNCSKQLANNIMKFVNE